ncbi:hypothetical protein P154DRAFT_539592 [Amniculicola lignicola CBS 123094]|uniref:Uncharacterized protein n=1 Tax=Amniculicola lignicola CBS 123094 TaxID=1392246 RepID=A0A6A5W0E8_9PLEO|nr:hypothetical protein P154DRAFT_539592 [Amniculicola lignicola CBS 123094]
MCNILLQVYACSHTEAVCLTPCSSALRPLRVPVPPSPSTPTPTQGYPSPRPISPAYPYTYGLEESRNEDTTQLHHSTSASSTMSRMETGIDAPPSSPVPAEPRGQIEGPGNVQGQHTPPPSYLQTSTTTFRPSTPYLPSPSPSPSFLSISTPQYTSLQYPTHTYCNPPSSRHLPTSAYPCVQCYLQPRWKALRERWVQEYRSTHRGTREEDVERLAGIEHVAEQAGVLNVGRLMGSGREKGSEGVDG